MKVGSILIPNVKGQIVIPKEIRDALGINTNVPLNLVIRGKGIYLYPIEELITQAEVEGSYLKLLEKTEGTWVDEDWKKLKEKREKIELLASDRRKRIW